MKSVLVVDDCEVFRRPIEMALRAAGYRTISAGNGQEALDILATEQPDLILLDVAMPVMDGLAFLRTPVGQTVAARTPVIVITALSEQELISDACRLGARERLLKSRFSLRELLECVRKHTTRPGEPSRAAS